MDPQSASKVVQPPSRMLPASEQPVLNQIASGEEIIDIGRDSQKPISPPLRTVSENPTKATRAHPGNTIKVLKATACTDVKNRNPLAGTKPIRWSMDRIYIWNLLKCESPPSSIRHIYYFKVQKISDVLLEIRSPFWRTWSFKTLSDKRFIGPWRVDITSAEGKVLQSISFEVH